MQVERLASWRLQSARGRRLRYQQVHPSNLIHKKAKSKPAPEPALKPQTYADSQHQVNKTAVIVGTVGVAALLFIALVFLVDQFFKQKRYNRENYQPGMFGQKPNDLSGSFKWKAHNTGKETGQNRSHFAEIFQLIFQSLAVGFQSSGDCPDDSSDNDHGSKKD